MVTRRTMTASGPTRRPLRAAWRVAAYALLASLAIGLGLGVAAVVASGSVDRDPAHAAGQFGPALVPFILAVTIAAYAIQRSRIAATRPPPGRD